MSVCTGTSTAERALHAACPGLLHSIRDIPHSSHTCKNTSVGTRCLRCLLLIRTLGLPPLPWRAIYGPREHPNRLRDRRILAFSAVGSVVLRRSERLAHLTSRRHLITTDARSGEQRLTREQTACPLMKRADPWPGADECARNRPEMQLTASKVNERGRAQQQHRLRCFSMGAKWLTQRVQFPTCGRWRRRVRYGSAFSSLLLNQHVGGRKGFIAGSIDDR